MLTYLMNSIYLATEGEGVLLGTPQVFVRFQGCAIGCSNCDSKDTWEFDQKTALSQNEVLEKISVESKKGLVKRVSITGGDPLHPQHVPAVVALVKELKARGYQINIEAAGTRVVHEIFDLVDFISFDFKTPSTGVKTKIDLLIKMVEQYPNRFQIKSVIETEDDFRETLRAYEEVERKVEGFTGPWCLTPCYNLEEAFPQKRFIDVMDWNINAGAKFRVIGQQHKWIFGPDEKQV